MSRWDARLMDGVDRLGRAGRRGASAALTVLRACPSLPGCAYAAASSTTPQQQAAADQLQAPACPALDLCQATARAVLSSVPALHRGL